MYLNIILELEINPDSRTHSENEIWFEKLEVGNNEVKVTMTEIQRSRLFVRVIGRFKELIEDWRSNISNTRDRV